MNIIGIVKPERFFAPWEFVRSLLRLRDYKILESSGSLIDENRNSLIEMARDFDGLLMIDTDMVFTKSDVDLILTHKDKDIVCGLFKLGQPPFEYGIYKDGLRLKDVPEEPFEIDACGMAFTYISKKAMRALPRGFERIIKDRKLLGEDLSFCQRAKEAGFKIYCDPRVKVGHIRTQIV